MKEKKENRFELYFEWWLNDLKKVGLVKSYVKEPNNVLVLDPVTIYSNMHYQTKEKKIVSHNLCKLASYTRDYDVVFHRSLLDVFIGYLIKIEPNVYELKELHHREKGDSYFEFSYYYIQNISEINGDWITVSFDVKPPAAALAFSASLTSSREFPYNQKLTLEKFNIFVNKVVPTGSKTSLFSKTFFPSRFLFTDGGRQERKINMKFTTKISSIEEWMRSLNLKPIL